MAQRECQFRDTSVRVKECEWHNDSVNFEITQNKDKVIASMKIEAFVQRHRVLILAI